MTLFRRKTPADAPDSTAEVQAASVSDAAATDAATAGTAVQQNDDRTDPLGEAMISSRATLVREGPGGRVERIEVWGPDGLSEAFLRLSVADAARADRLRELLLALPEQATGFSDLLVDDTAALAAKFELAPASLAELAGSGKLYRPLDIAEALRDIAALLASVHASSGWVWPQPDSTLVGLTAEQVFPAAGFNRWRASFGAWDALDAGDEAPAARELARLFIAPLDSLLTRAQQAGFAPAHLPLAQLLGQLELLAENVTSYAELASGMSAYLDSLRLMVHGETDTGRRRDHNEDAYCLLKLNQASMAGVRFVLAAIADGMGGHASGEVASSLALDLLRAQLSSLVLAPRTRHADPQLAGQIGAIIPAIGRALGERAAMEPQLAGMGTTLVGIAHMVQTSTVVGSGAVPALTNQRPEAAATLPRPSGVIFWTGDSRAYLLGPAGMHPLSVDHSYVQGLLAAGQITPDEAFSHPQKNIITRCLGGSGDDRPEVAAFTPGPGELVLLCSDGLSDALRDADIWRVACESGTNDLDTIATALIDAANAAGGPDNITVVLVATA